MATASAPNQSINHSTTTTEHSNNASSSYFRKTVCLQDWWLIKAENEFEGKRLAVAGLTSRVQQALRVFSSAPILKRNDVFTLETVDGIIVLIEGFMNKVRTEENGFPPEVCNHFVFGFPPYWEKYAEKCLGEGFSNMDVSRSTLDRDKLSSNSDSVAGVDDLSEGMPKRNKPDVSKRRHGDSERMDLSSEACGKMFFTKGQHILQDGACNESSVKDPKICSSQVVSEMIAGGASKDFGSQNHATDSFDGGEAEFHVSIGSGVSTSGSKYTVRRYGLTSDNEVHPGSTAGPVNIEQGKKGIADSQSKKMNRALKSSIARGDANLIDDFQIAVGKKETNVKTTSQSTKQTKRKLTYESPVTGRGTEKTSIISPQSLSHGRSRSGRLLVRPLEFWRNETAIYDADHQITGIQEGLRDVEPSTGLVSKSDPSRKQRKLP